MTTGAVIVQDAMIQAGIIDAGATVSTNDQNLVLRRLNRMIASWDNEPLMLFALSSQSFTMVSGQADYPSSTYLTDGRPVSIDAMYVRLSSIDYPVDVIDNQTWNAIPYKPTTGIPNQCFVDTDYPTTTLRFYPTPYAAFTCFVQARTPLTASITESTDVLMPQGYEKAIVDGLAVDIAPSFGAEVTPIMLKASVESRRVLRRNNYVPLIMDTGLADNRPSPDAFISRGF
jgi:hypothetical protein